MNRSTGMKWLVASVTAVVAVSLVAAAFVLGSPAQQRQRRLDERRAQDIANIVNSVRQYARAHDALPPELAALGKEPGLSRSPPLDPQTHIPYEYRTPDTESFELCAVFSLPSPSEGDPYFNQGRSAYSNTPWIHSAGKQCFKYKRKDNGDEYQRIPTD
jgi:type II secretory pathway pseudopilin PulG